MVEQADGSVIVESFRVAGGIRKLSRQGRKASAHEGDRKRLCVLTEMVHRGVDCGQFLGGRLLKLVHQDQCPDAQFAGGLIHDLEERREIVREASGVRNPGTSSTSAPRASAPVAGLNFNENALKTPSSRCNADSG